MGREIHFTAALSSLMREEAGVRIRVEVLQFRSCPQTCKVRQGAKFRRIKAAEALSIVKGESFE